MGNDDDKDSKRGFKVEDRRRFADTGEPRADTPADTPRAATIEATSNAAPSPPQSAGPADFEMNFSTFIISLSTQALAHLGEIPNPIDNRLVVDLVAAKQLIDILGLLQEKTKGNLDATEGGLLERVLYDLRINYVERARGRSEKS
jgi:hypothetical protein